MGYVRINLKADARKRAAAIITTSLFTALFIGMGAVSLILERPTVSETENRDLETLPGFSVQSYLSGSFAAQLDKYFTDTVPFRDKLTEYAAVLENAKGIPSPQFYGVKIVNPESAEMIDALEPDTLTEPAVPDEKVRNADHADETSPMPAESVSPSVTAPPIASAPSAASGTETSQIAESSGDEEFVGDISDFLTNGIIVDGVDMYGEKAGIMLFGGNDKQGQRYAELISSYKRELGDGVNVYNMVVPTSVEFYLPKKYAKYSNSEKREIEFIYSKLTDGVIPVDAYSAIEAHKDEYIYFRTDHHWTDLGAYYAYTAFCNAIGQTPPALSDYTVKTKDELFVGSLFGYTNNIILKNNPDTFTYYMTKSDFKGETYNYRTITLSEANPIYHQYATGSNMYGRCLGGDGSHIKITTSAGTGRKIVVFKESYGNAFAPYLIDSFDEIYVIDIRYFGKNALQYIKDVGATDVLFINNVFAANTSKLIDGIERLLISPTGTIVYTAPAETTSVPAETDQQGLPIGQVSQSQQPQQTVQGQQMQQVQQTQQTQQVQQTQPPAANTQAAQPTQPAQTQPVQQSQQVTAAPAVTAPPAATTQPAATAPPAPAATVPQTVTSPAG
ncbi:MAG: hypothetical protein K2J72_12305 [Oscillospiraceae bacterium]|nr:hypothetical protein [Oscillospiraceae bacterium]